MAIQQIQHPKCTCGVGMWTTNIEDEGNRFEFYLDDEATLHIDIVESEENILTVRYVSPMDVLGILSAVVELCIEEKAIFAIEEMPKFLREIAEFIELEARVEGDR